MRPGQILTWMGPIWPRNVAKNVWNVCVCVWKTRVFYVSLLVGLNFRTWNPRALERFVCSALRIHECNPTAFIAIFQKLPKSKTKKQTQVHPEWWWIKVWKQRNMCVSQISRATPNVYSITYITPWKVLMLRLFVYSNYSGENSCASSLRSDPSFVKLSQTLKPLWIASWQLTYLLWKALLKILFPLCDILVFWGVYVGWVMLKDQLKLVAL